MECEYILELRTEPVEDPPHETLGQNPFGGRLRRICTP